MAQIRADEIASVLREEIEGFDQAIQVAETGYVAAVGDGIAHIHGIDKVMAGELLAFPYGISGIALNLDEDEVGAVILGEADEIKEGDEVRRTGRIMSVPVGPNLIGRVVDALGQPIDGKGPIDTKAVSYTHLEAAESAVAQAANKMAAYEKALAEARAGIYAGQEENRKRLGTEQAAAVEAARGKAAAQVAAARVEIAAEAEFARAGLAAESDRLAEQIAQAVLAGKN